MTDMQPESAATGDRSARGIAEGLAALAEWSCRLGWRDVPGSVRRRIAAIFADDLSAIVAARDEPELAALVDALARSSGPREASLFDGSGRRLDRYSAALANGSAADWCELDSGYRRAVCHGGIYCMPALLAEGEVSGAALEDMLLAFVVGYETVSRIARAFEYDDLAIHPHGSLAAVGAAATVAALRRLPAGLRAAAISSAATLVSPGPFGHAVEGALIRNVWPGIGASTGLRAVDWAELGIAGSQGGLHDVYGTVFGGTARPEALTEGLGQSWAASDGYHKLHACCQYSHAAVEAALEIAAALPRRAAPEEIRAIRVDTHWRGRKLDNVRPATTLAAKFSMQHVLATVAVHGHAGAAAFRASTLADPAITALAGTGRNRRLRAGAGLAERPAGARFMGARRRDEDRPRVSQRARRAGPALHGTRTPQQDRRDRGGALSGHGRDGGRPACALPGPARTALARHGGGRHRISEGSRRLISGIAISSSSVRMSMARNGITPAKTSSSFSGIGEALRTT